MGHTKTPNAMRIDRDANGPARENARDLLASRFEFDEWSTPAVAEPLSCGVGSQIQRRVYLRPVELCVRPSPRLFVAFKTLRHHLHLCVLHRRAPHRLGWIDLAEERRSALIASSRNGGRTTFFPWASPFLAPQETRRPPSSARASAWSRAAAILFGPLITIEAAMGAGSRNK